MNKIIRLRAIKTLRTFKDFKNPSIKTIHNQ